MMKSLGNLFAALAVVGMAVPVHATSPETSGPTPLKAVQDICLTKDNLLVGAVVDASGKLKANAVVQISQGKKVIATLKTDSQGRYAVKGLRPGVHTVKTSDSSRTCRFWASSMAPPKSQKALVLAQDGQIVRGQLGGGGVGSVLLPVAFFGAVAAITIASTTGDDDVVVSPPASP